VQATPTYSRLLRRSLSFMDAINKYQNAVKKLMQQLDEAKAEATANRKIAERFMETATMLSALVFEPFNPFPHVALQTVYRGLYWVFLGLVPDFLGDFCTLSIQSSVYGL
jgi:hypothetical protein